MKLLYSSIIESHLLYGLVLWGNTYKYLLKPIHLLQKKAIRLVAKKRFNFPTDDFFMSLKLLNAAELYKAALIKLMYRFHHSKLPKSLQCIFRPNNQLHTYNTRNSAAPHLFVVSKTCYLNSFVYLAPVMWLKLPYDVRILKSCKLIIRKAKSIGLMCD